MAKVIIAGAGGAPSEGVIRSMMRCERGDTILGMGSEPTDLALSAAVRRYIVPYADAPEYRGRLLQILKTEKPELIHFPNDLEIYSASLLRSEIASCGVRTYMPSHQTIDICVHKHLSYLRWRAAGVRVPDNILIQDATDLRKAFEQLGDQSGRIWLRATSIGGGGKGALPTADFDFARAWINHYRGWGQFSAAAMLTPDSVTWQSIWHEGELVVAQTRKRLGWTHGNRTLSGVTGVTKVGQTCSDHEVDRVAMDSILAIEAKPHGIFGVDMTYDTQGIPNPTEINISRFFTTILFFTEAGLNMPKIFKDIALHNEFPVLEKRINPLPEGLLWLRGMDTTPKLFTEAEMNELLIELGGNE